MQCLSALLPRDLPLKLAFSYWLRNETITNPRFLELLLLISTSELKLLHTLREKIILRNSFLSILELQLSVTISLGFILYHTRTFRRNSINEKTSYVVQAQRCSTPLQSSGAPIF